MIAWTPSRDLLTITITLPPHAGPVVRVAPNEVSFNSPQSWNDIYGFRQGHQTFLKSEFYEGGSFASRGVHSIVSERDVDAHAQMRRHLAHAFSDRSLSEQEALVAETVDKFVRLVGNRGGGPDGFDIGKGLEMMTFDIVGDLAFGETFGGVDSGECFVCGFDLELTPVPPRSSRRIYGKNGIVLISKESANLETQTRRIRGSPLPWVLCGRVHWQTHSNGFRSRLVSSWPSCREN